jgi:hypothetical protein
MKNNKSKKIGGRGSVQNYDGRSIHHILPSNISFNQSSKTPLINDLSNKTIPIKNLSPNDIINKIKDTQKINDIIYQNVFKIQQENPINYNINHLKYMKEPIIMTGDDEMPPKMKMQIDNIFNKYKKTNNGILYDNNDDDDDDMKKGGSTFSFIEMINPNKKEGQTFFNTLSTAFNTYQVIFTGINDYSNKLNICDTDDITEYYKDEIVDGVFICSYLKSLFDKKKYHNMDNYYLYITGNDDSYFDGSIISDDLHRLIKENYTYSEDIKTIICDKDKKYKKSELEDSYKFINDPRYTDKKEIKLDFSYHQYNKDIVTAYERNYIENFQNLQEFLKRQEIYVNGLSLANKIIINDYTKFDCFRFYKSYVNSYTFADISYAKYIDGRWIKDHYVDETDRVTKIIYKKFCFGDSLYKQIIDVIGILEFNSIIHGIDKSKINEKIIKGSVEYIKLVKSLIQEKGRFYENIDDYWLNNNNERKDYNEISIFADKLDNVTWHYIMIQFIQDLNEIISKAPRTITPIYCYRGTTFDYVILKKKEEVLEDHAAVSANIKIPAGTYTSVRIGSFSINFNASKVYTVDYEGKQGNMYRVTILPDIPVLYAASLSFASHEFELLHAGYAEFTNRGEVLKSYNNKNNKWGILSNDEETFDSVDITLNRYNNNISPFNDTSKVNNEIAIYRRREFETDIGQIFRLQMKAHTLANKVRENIIIKKIKDRDGDGGRNFDDLTEQEKNEKIKEMKKEMDKKSIRNSINDYIKKMYGDDETEISEEDKEYIKTIKNEDHINFLAEDRKNLKEFLKNNTPKIRKGGKNINDSKYIHYKLKNKVYKRKVYKEGRKNYIIINKQKKFI